MSDHGYRGNMETSFKFKTLNAIYLTDKNYQGFYDGISNVNQLKVLLNTQFKQQLKMLPDSTIILTQ